MKWPIRNQIFVPFAVLLTTSVILVALVSAWNAADQSRQQQQQHMQAVTQALGDASFPLTPDVVKRIAGMIGGEVIVSDRDGNVTASTLELRSLPASLADLTGANSETTTVVQLGSTEYFVTLIPRFRVPRPGPLFILIPQQDLTALRRSAILPPLVVAIPTLALALITAMLIARRLSRRVDELKTLFAELAAGRFPGIAVSQRRDELRELMQSANDLSCRLQQLQSELQRSERLQLLGQLSGGLAHQLKNSITGARLAIQLHQQQCSNDDRELLKTAISQLRLTDEQVMAVLSLRTGAADSREESRTVDLSAMIEDVRLLLLPQCLHWKTQLLVGVDGPFCTGVSLRSPSSMRGALLNLVLNAVQAAGTGGTVEIRLQGNAEEVTIDIRDDGPGFDTAVDSLIDAFQTTKPQGIGLGLTIAQHSVQREGGRMTITRNDNQTSVMISIPQDLHGEHKELTACLTR